MITTLKTCFKCGVERPLTEFYKHPQMGDGYLGKCKDCTRRDVNENRARKIEYYRQYDRGRGFRIYDIVKVRARAATRALKERKPCEICGHPKTDAHHPDYSKPLEVKWLCRKHHAEEHMRIRNV